MDGVCRFVPCAPTCALTTDACSLVVTVLLRLYALRALVSVRLRLAVRVRLADFSVCFAARLFPPGYMQTGVLSGPVTDSGSAYTTSGSVRRAGCCCLVLLLYVICFSL